MKTKILVLAVLLLFVSCAYADPPVSQESNRAAYTTTTEKFDVDILDELDLTKTPESTCFSAIGYENKTNTLIVTFRDSGSKYIYLNFPEDEWEIFCVQQSLGGWYNKHIKGQYECERIY